MHLREAGSLQPLPRARYDTAYLEMRQVGWDSYIEVRGNRYSVPSTYAGQRVTVRIGLDGQVRVYAEQTLVATHQLQSPQQGWVTVPEHHVALWKDALCVEQRPLAVYEEVATWNS